MEERQFYPDVFGGKLLKSVKYDIQFFFVKVSTEGSNVRTEGFK